MSHRFFQKDWYNSYIFVGILCACALVVLNWHSFYVYWTSPLIQGWDAPEHASLVIDYARSIFPSLWGWMNNWSAGMPFPQFYPPLFYFFMAGLIRLLPFISPLVLFKAFVSVLQCSVPLALVWFISRRTSRISTLWVGGIGSIIILSSYFVSFDSIGVNVYSTLHTGLVAQLLGFIFFVFWLDQFLSMSASRKAFLWSAIWLAAVALSNVHMVFTALFFFVASCIASIYFSSWQLHHAGKRLSWHDLVKLVSKYLLNGAVAVMLTAAWSLPMLVYYRYLDTVPSYMTPSPLIFVTEIVVITILIVVCAYVALRRTKQDLAVITLAGILLMPMILLQSGQLAYFSLPAQVNRWLAPFIIFLPVMLALAYDSFLEWRWASRHRISIAIILLAFFAAGMGTYSLKSDSGFYFDYYSQHLSDIASYLTHTPRSGLTMVESTLGYQHPTMWIVNSFVGLATPSATTILRESSPSSQFITPVRNALSQYDEGWGFRSYLMFDQTFLSQPVSLALDRAARLGIGSFLLDSKYAKDRIVSDQRIYMEKDFGDWTLYSFRADAVRAVMPQIPPVAFFGPITFKDRGIADYDWSRFQEAILYADASSTYLYYPEDPYLDTSKAFDSAAASIVTSYRYHDLSSAYARLVSYIGSHTLVLVADADPLFNKLEQYGESNPSPNLVIIPRLTSSIPDPNPLQAQLGPLFGLLALKMKSGNLPNATVSTVDISNGRISVGVNDPTGAAVPILVESSYFPAWQRADGVPIYLASPSYILTYATSSFSMVFTTPWSVYLGYVISLCALCAISIGLYTCRRSDSALFAPGPEGRIGKHDQA